MALETGHTVLKALQCYILKKKTSDKIKMKSKDKNSMLNFATNSNTESMYFTTDLLVRTTLCQTNE